MSIFLNWYLFGIIGILLIIIYELGVKKTEFSISMEEILYSVVTSFLGPILIFILICIVINWRKPFIKISPNNNKS